MNLYDVIFCNYVADGDMVLFYDDFYFYDFAKLMGLVMYFYCGLVAVLLALFLLVAIIGSILLIFNAKYYSKRYYMFKQVERSFNRILRFKN